MEGFNLPALLPTPRPDGSAFYSHRLRIHPVVSDGMAPTLNIDDFVLVRPVSGYEGEGVYLLGEELYRATSFARDGRVHLSRDNKLYSPETLTADEFADRVLAKVVADIKVREHAALRESA